MRKHILFIWLGLLSLVTTLQAQQVITTTGYSITAIVQKNNGRIQLKTSPGDSASYPFTDYNKSFVTFKVNNKYYTNNNVGFSPVPVNISILNTGTVIKIVDTVRTTWTTAENVDLIQDVYPAYLYEYSWAIVMKWSAVNKSSSAVQVSVQYLLNTVGGSDGDGIDKVLTKYGYNNSWRQYTNAVGDSMPWSYYVSAYHLLNAGYMSPSFNPGPDPIGHGILEDKTFTLGLKKPSRFTIGDWGVLNKEKWGPKMPLPSINGTDLATLTEWNEVVLNTGKSSELGRTAYARPYFQRCYYPAVGLTFNPLEYTKKNRGVVNDTIQYEMFLFQGSYGGKFGSPFLSLNVGNALKIISPSPILESGKKQIQNLSPDSLPYLGVYYAGWTLVIDTSKLLGEESTELIKVSGRSTSHPNGFFTSGGSNDTCYEFILIRTDDWKADTIPPLYTSLPPLDSSTRRISFSEIRALDSGLKSISWTFATPADSSNFIITPQQIVGACMRGIDTISIVQKDTTNWGCIDFVVLDCAGNKTETRYCVPGKVYIPVDTLPPYTTDHKTKDKLTKEFTVVDPFLNSSYIKSVEHLPPPTLPSFNQSILFNTNCTMSGGRIIVQRVDSLQAGCVYYTITDCANNSTVDSICFVADTSLGVTDIQDDDIFSILGNPSTGRATVLLSLEKPQDITLRIVDALGREVRRIDVKGLSQGENLIPLQTSELASGTYYVIVEIDGKQFAKSLKVVR